MTITDGEKEMTLEQLAARICNNISGEDAGGCYDGSCPASSICRHGRNGMLLWLRKMLGE